MSWFSEPHIHLTLTFLPERKGRAGVLGAPKFTRRLERSCVEPKEESMYSRIDPITLFYLALCYIAALAIWNLHRAVNKIEIHVRCNKCRRVDRINLLGR
jgi:hypothetical protein